MNKKTKKYLPYICICFAVILFLLAITINLNPNIFTLNNNINQKNKLDSKEKENNQEKESSKDENITIDNQNKDKEANKETTTNKNQETDTSTNNNETTNNNQTSPIQTPNDNQNEVDITKSEQNVISHFQTMSLDIDSMNNQEDLTHREKAKNIFITIIDFIFYDKEIKGYKFNDLTMKAKLEIIKIATTIDNKIDSYFPSYKDFIKDKYNSIKSKLIVLYMDTAANLCNSVGEDTCNQAKSDFKDMKESFGFTWSLIKEILSSGSTKIKDWYESIR